MPTMSDMKLSILVAISTNGVIGRDGSLPWRLPDELRYVKKTTMGHTLLMGRKTYESIGKPLPGRTSIVVSRNPDYAPHPDVIVVDSVAAGLAAARERDESEVFVFGGESIYAETLGTASRLYLTRVDVEIEGDAFFPALDFGDWKLASEEHHTADEKHAHAFTFQTFERV
ncbi:MAG: dihydrofolate reductase [Myxococcota bacterium]|jgi:dihydrofolate reductase